MVNIANKFALNFVKKMKLIICNRDRDSCNYRCASTSNFSDEKCENCEHGLYTLDDGCNLECSDNCEDKLVFRQEDCSMTACKSGFLENNVLKIVVLHVKKENVKGKMENVANV